METIKLNIKTTELSRELLYEGYTMKIDCTNFWDSHGKRVEYAPTQHKFDREKKFEIYKVISETFYPAIPYTQQYEDWVLYIEGEKLDIGEMMSYRHLKTKLKLDCCIGAG